MQDAENINLEQLELDSDESVLDLDVQTSNSSKNMIIYSVPIIKSIVF